MHFGEAKPVFSEVSDMEDEILNSTEMWTFTAEFLTEPGVLAEEDWLGT